MLNFLGKRILQLIPTLFFVSILIFSLQQLLPGDPAQRKATYEKLTRIVLNDEPLIYLYHRKLLIAHTTKLEGYKQMPDGLVRVIGLKLK